MLCISCGSKCLHIGCGNLDKDIIEWECDECSLIAGVTSSSYSRSRYLSNGLESCSPPIGNQANCSAAQGPQPGKEGQRNSSSGCSNDDDDDDSDVEIIAIIPAPARSSSYAQSPRYLSSKVFFSNFKVFSVISINTEIVPQFFRAFVRCWLCKWFSTQSA